MKIYAVSDLHGSRPAIPECDLLLIGGDICPMWPSHEPEWQLGYLDGPFRCWLNYLHADCGIKHIVGIAGNHDFVFEKLPGAVDALILPWTYLQDGSTCVNDLWIYGIPWVPNLASWAFYATKEGLALRYEAIPKGTDIVLSHGPPFGYGDLYAGTSEHIGCKSATNMLSRVQPKALVCGHIHEGFGSYRFEHRNGHVMDIYNVSFVDENYRPRPFIDGAIEITLDLDVKSDAIEEQTDPERPVRDTATDTRSPQELIA